IVRWYCQETMALPGDNRATAPGDGREATAASMTATSPKEVPALTRGLAVLRLLGRSEEPLGVNAVARQLGLVPSTCLHILRSEEHTSELQSLMRISYAV